MMFKTDQGPTFKGWEEIILGAYYSGERFIVKRKEGESVAIIPIEDLEVLEELEKEALGSRYPTRKISIHCT